LERFPGHEQFGDLLLARSEPRGALHDRLLRGFHLMLPTGQFQCRAHASEQLSGPHRLLDEVDRPRVHRTNRRRHAPVRGEHDDRQSGGPWRELLEEIEAALSA